MNNKPNYWEKNDKKHEVEHAIHLNLPSMTNDFLVANISPIDYLQKNEIPNFASNSRFKVSEIATFL